MMKHAAILFLLLVMLCGSPVLAQSEYPDGIYRGFYYDGGIEQIAIQFELRGGLFDSLVFRGVRYKDGNYLSEDASDAQKAIVAQYRQMADHLIGKDVRAIDDLYMPFDFVEDADAVTSATIQSSKLISALWDGLNRRPFKLVNTSKLPAAEPFGDGVYRGTYMEDGGEQVAVEFTLRENRFVSFQFRALQYRGQDYLSEDAPETIRQIAGQFMQLGSYLVGREVADVNNLYLPGEIVADIVFSIACLVAISPLILLMMLLIVIDDPKGGPLYQQERIGKNGKNFQMYKLRSMIVNADDQLEQLAQRNEFHGKAFKMKRDPRITRIGRFIRKTSIDELMQLINVLKGDMSFVGPRPPLPDEAGQYDEYERQRLLVTPGMTCFWQIQPNRHEMDFEDWVALDLRYIMERNLWMDLKMILRTVWVVAKSFLPCSHSR